METKGNDNFDIFNVTVDDVTLPEREKKISNIYKPDPSQAKDGVYKSLIRFVPNPKNPKRSIIKKYVYWLKDSDGNGHLFDSPSTIGEPCSVQKLFFKLRNSESAADQRMAEKLKRRTNFYSLIQVVKDPQNPEFEGKFMVFKYGWKIKEKLDSVMEPEFDEPVNVFHPFDGKNFELVVTRKTTPKGTFNNYDSSKFSSKISPIIINDKPVENTEEGRNLILEKLKEAPELESFGFNPLSDAEKAKLEEILNMYRSPAEQVDNVVNESSAKNKNSSKASATDDVFETTNEKSSNSESDDDLDEFLDGLDI